MNAVTKSEAGALALSEPELLQVLGSSLYPGASHDSIRMVLGYCKAAGLDPMQKPVHIVPMWDSKAGQMRDVVMPGIGLYRTQAARSGCAGVSEPDFGPDVTESIGGQEITYPAWCRVTVRRQLSTGAVAEFSAKELWRENYAVRGGKEKSIAPNAMWTKRPYGQLAKCAEAQALRKAFPEIGSEPTADEMAGKTINEFAEHAAQQQPATPAILPQPAVWPEANFATQFARWSKAVSEGIKTTADILALARSKGELTADQEARIKALAVPQRQPDESTDQPTE